MISNGAKTTRYKINPTKRFEIGSDRSVADSCGAGRRVVDPIVCGQLWSMADSCGANSGVTACSTQLLWSGPYSRQQWNEHYSKRNLRQAATCM